MHPLTPAESTALWAAFEERFRFRPSTRVFPGIAEPADSIAFRLAETTDDAMLDELKAAILDAFQACGAFSGTVCFLDWQHTGYRIDRDAAAVWANGYPDGDYAIFFSAGMSMGTFGHPWEQSICLFGDRFVRQMLQRRPRILASVLRNPGGYAV